MSAAEPGVGGVPLPWLQNHGGLLEGVQRLSIKLYKLSLHSNLPRGFILWIIEVGIKLLDQGHINVTIRLSGQGFMPTTPLELLIELIILRYV